MIEEKAAPPYDFAIHQPAPELPNKEALDSLSGDTHSDPLLPLCANPLCARPGDFALRQGLCPPCNDAFRRGDFCFYCRQLYTEEEDGESWVECENCAKWVHTGCQLRAALHLVSSNWQGYRCPSCRSDPRIGQARKPGLEQPKARALHRERPPLEQYVQLAARKNAIQVKTSKRSEPGLREALSRIVQEQDLAFFRSC